VRPNKYKPIPEVVDGYRFPSRYEATIYRLINSLLTTANATKERYRLDRQVEVVIYDGLLMPKRVWKCDFAITDLKTGKSILIEAKGMLPREFSYLIDLLASNNPKAFMNLVVVSENESLRSKFWGTLEVQTSTRFYNNLKDKLQRGIHGNFSL
jgi:hypothetical protein